MSLLPPFIAKLIAPDGFEEKKYFETREGAQKWILTEGLRNFDGDILRAEIHHESQGLMWFKDHPKTEEDAFFLRMRGNPDSHMNFRGLPDGIRKKLKETR